MISELLRPAHAWLRLCDPDWEDPTEGSFAAATGGRWNRPGSAATLYLNEDVVTARMNVDLFIGESPYTVHDLRDDAGPQLATLTLPADQTVTDAHTPAGLRAVGLPDTYPGDETGGTVPHRVCQPIGDRAYAAGLDGVLSRSAGTPDGVGREVAWFLRGRHAYVIDREAFGTWYWA